MKFLIVLSLIALASSITEDREVCTQFQDDFKICNTSDTLTRCIDEKSPPRRDFTLELADGTKTTIGGHAFSNLSLESLWIEGPEGGQSGMTDWKPSVLLLSDSFAGMKNLKLLSLRRVLIIFNEVNTLEPLELLRKLEVEGSNLTDVPRNMLAAVPNVRRLSLNKNKIREIRTSSFAPLMHLEVLDLSENGINCIQPGAFETPDPAGGLPELGELNLSFNEIEEVPRGVFEKLRLLRKLDLSGNKIREITPGAFGSLILEDLILASNHIKVIETETFSGLSALRLSLNANQVQELKPRAFRGLINDLLDLSFNGLERIDGDDFEGFRTGTLKLGFNDIGIIEEGALNGTVQRRLEIYGNKGIGNLMSKSDLGLGDSVELVSTFVLNSE